MGIVRFKTGFAHRIHIHVLAYLSDEFTHYWLINYMQYKLSVVLSKKKNLKFFICTTIIDFSVIFMPIESNVLYVLVRPTSNGLYYHLMRVDLKSDLDRKSFILRQNLKSIPAIHNEPRTSAFFPWIFENTSRFFNKETMGEGASVSASCGIKGRCSIFCDCHGST